MENIALRYNCYALLAAILNKKTSAEIAISYFELHDLEHACSARYKSRQKQAKNECAPQRGNGF